ncbi:hypothetical protein CH275_16435 [Rhodococcus sp. 06-235-1A]|uniref:PIG-L deacetylase family protein n=1 Tax=Rhodococcus sp. 06-235-1A TaxID=2022508 RepID=UPI000B9C61DF|nr:PIG-L family deacetylase [Rhodococcus sp. 06-235-1A]OZD03365.1 hypothetical protein CH275_16435 [Rhodococcus sp. 06-235-1A]
MTARLLAVHPHPDDEVSRGGATIAHYAARGIESVLVTCTDGAAGRVLNPRFVPPPDYDLSSPIDMANIRSTELECSARTLGYVRTHRLPFGDSGPDGTAGGSRAFAHAPLADSARALAAVIRQERPDVIVGYGPKHARDPHPDHLRSHVVLLAALDIVGRADIAVFWVAFSLQRHRALSRRCTEREVVDPYASGIAFGPDGFDDAQITTRVPLDLVDFTRRNAALRCHASQVAADSGWFALSAADMHGAFPYEEFIQWRPKETRSASLFA